MLELGDSTQTQPPETSNASTPFHHSSREAGFPTAWRIPWTHREIVRVSGGATCQEETSQNKQQ